MARRKLTLEYDGAFFNGWQAQPIGNTVQQTVESALLTLIRSEQKKKGLSFSSSVEVVGSGRTDAGVSALGQVCHCDIPDSFELDSRTIQKSLNGILPNQLKVSRIEAVDQQFHARHSPHSKVYSYNFLLRDSPLAIHSEQSLVIGVAVDVIRMVEAAKQIEGTHDFQSFRASDCKAKSTERTILFSELSRKGDSLVYRIQGKGFLKQMVRIIAGTLEAVGKGKIGSVSEVIEARDRKQAGDTAPPGPLCLEAVNYYSNNYFK